MSPGLRCLVAALAFSALLPSPAQAKDTPDAVVLDASFKPAEQATRLLRVTEGKAMKDLKKVAVPLFTVEFVIADSERAETSGFAAAGRASASVYYKLKGLEEADFETITAALYQRFLDDLKEAGIEVLPFEQVAASPTYKKLAASGVPSPIKSDAAITMAAPGMAIYGFNKMQSGGSGGAGLFSALSQMGAGFGGVSAALDTVALQQELGAAVIEARMKVNFVQLTNNNKGFLGRLAGTASVEGKVQPSVGSATFSVQSTTRGSMTLTNPLALDAAAFSDVRKKPTTAADVAGGVAVALLRLALNSKDSSSSEEMEAVADPAKYRDIVGSGLATVTQMFVQRLKAGE